MSYRACVKALSVWFSEPGSTLDKPQFLQSKPKSTEIDVISRNEGCPTTRPTVDVNGPIRIER